MVAGASYDVVVVGGGIVGTSCAYHLVRDGVRVLLIDDEAPGRATAAGAGILSPETTYLTDPAWNALCRAAADRHAALADELRDAGGGDTGYARCGLVLVATDEREDRAHTWFRELVARPERARPGLGPIDPDVARQRFPALGPVLGAIENVHAARVDGRRTTAALAEAARLLGLVHHHGSVTGFESDGSRLTAVLAGDDVLACGSVVLSGGAWTPATAQRFGVDLPIRPRRGQIVHLGLPAGATDGWPIAQSVLGPYLVPWPDGRVVVGATTEDVGFDPRITAAGVQEILATALRVAPGLSEATVVDVRVGLRPMSADGLPFLGPLPGWDGVHVAAGHGPDGLLLGPVSGQVVAAGLQGRAVDGVPVDAFLPSADRVVDAPS